jgi:hypothetical protein
MSAAIGHIWERLDQSTATCVRCGSSSAYAAPLCSAPQIPVATVPDSVTVRRELDAIARQLAGISERLKRLRAAT